MKIIPEILSPDRAQATARAAEVYSAQWKKALEDARLQARQQAADAGVQRLPVDAGPDHADFRASKGSAPNAAPLPDAECGGTAQDVAAARTDALGRALIDASQSRLAARGSFAHAAIPAAGGTASATSLARLVPAANASEAPVASAELAQPQLQLNGLPEWPAVVVHASVAGNRINLVIRDRAVSVDEASALYQRLRGQLRAAGLDLGHLIVNGNTVTGDDDPGPVAQISQ